MVYLLKSERKRHLLRSQHVQTVQPYKVGHQEFSEREYFLNFGKQPDQDLTEEDFSSKIGYRSSYNPKRSSKSSKQQRSSRSSPSSRRKKSKKGSQSEEDSENDQEEDKEKEKRRKMCEKLKQRSSEKLGFDQQDAMGRQYGYGKKYGEQFQEKNLLNCEEFEQEGGSAVGAIIGISCGVLFLVGVVVYLISLIRKRRQVNQMYNDTPQHFSEKPSLSFNQNHNYRNAKFEPLASIKEDMQITEENSPTGQSYMIKFLNRMSQNETAVMWNRAVRTDCYFEVELMNLNSEIEFGFVHEKEIDRIRDMSERDIGRVGVSFNTLGQVEFLGESKYQFKDWQVDFGDVVGMGITKINDSRRVWITKNGILLNPPSHEEVREWLNTEKMNDDVRETFSHAPESKRQDSEGDEYQKKEDIDLERRKIVLSSAESFKYHAVIWCWKLGEDPSNKNVKARQPTVIRVNVGRKVFRLRDENLKSGLLADPFQKSSGIGMLCCCC